MSSSLLVSIIMPAFNASKTISESIDSILMQTYSNFELVIIDDFSEDSTVQIVMSYSDERICLVRNCVRRGVGYARNLGLEYASGQVIAFLDADDVWEVNKLSVQVDSMIQFNSLAVASPYSRWIKGKPPIVVYPGLPVIKYHDMLKSNHVGNLTGMYRADILGKVYFKLTHHEDYLMWLDVVKLADKIHSVSSSPLAKYRVHTSLSSNKIRSAFWRWKIYRNNLKFGIIKSIYYMAFYIFNGLNKRF